MQTTMTPQGMEVIVSERDRDNGYCVDCGTYAWVDEGRCEQCFPGGDE